MVHNGVDTSVFKPEPNAMLDRPAGDETIHFVYPSRILPPKGQHFAIDAIARLNRKHKRRARLTIVGAVNDPVYLDQLRIQAYNQPVDFALDVPDMHPYYQRADVVLYPTVMIEGFGFTAVEGMACGKPVIWFDQPAVREATAGLGVPVRKGDVEALRSAIERLMDSPAERKQMGLDGRRYVEDNLSWQHVWGRYETILQSLVS